MADDTTATAPALGTPDPSAIPANLAAVAPSGDATGIPTAIAAPAAGTDMPTPMGSTPGTEVPPDPEVAAGAVHQNWLSRILDTVGTILGGDKTIVATKHPDGSVSVEHNPSTTGEKWGRIAQAALGGAARGMAVGQGPGGAGRAFATGGLAGLQMPAQQLAAANEEAKNMNVQQLAIANMALTHQGYLANAEQMRERQIKFTQDQADRYNAILKSTRDAPGSEDLGNFVGVEDLPSLKAKYPDAYNAHIGQNDKVLQFDPQIDPTTLKQTGSHITLLSKPLSERTMPPGTPPLTQSYYDSATKTIKSFDIDPSNMTRLEYSTAHQNLTKQNSDLALNVEKDVNKMPTNLEELATAAQTETNPVRKQQLLDAYAQREKDTIREKQAGRAPAAATTPTLEGGGFGGPTGDVAIAPDGTPQPSTQGQQLLSQLDSGTAALVKQFGEYRGTVQNLPRGKEREPFLKLVAQVYPNFDQKEYNSRQALLTSMKTGQLAKTRQSLNTAISHMGDLSDAIDGLDPSEYRGVNATVNAARNQGFGDSSHLGKFNTAGNGVSQELATAFKGTGAGTQTETNEWRKNLDPNSPASMQRSSMDEALSMLAGRMDAMQDTIQKGMGTTSAVPLLSPRSIATLHRIPGGDGVLEKYNIPIPQTGTPSNAPARAPATAAPAATVPNSNPAAAATAPKQVFNATTWAAANPGKDVNAAIAKATAQGIPVVK